jgi:3-hydroxyisobutyrate dehydrogenase-like beta-hydroxyacid dehydrogenase
MKITVLGLGIIGGAWAKNLQDDKYEVRCWNRSKKDFPNFQPDAVTAVEGAEFIIIVVSDPPAVQAVLDQIAPKLKQGQVVIQSSTISAAWTKKFAQQVEKTGAQFLEAPFTGSKPAAEKRETVFYVGGDKNVLEKSRPLLERIGKTILYVGPIGSASSLKLAMNMNLALIGQALCESLTFARQQGIADDMFEAALKNNAGRSAFSDFKIPKLKAADFSPQFSVQHMNKDLGLAVESMGSLDLPLTRSVKKIYETGIERGWKQDDVIGLIRLLGKF